MLTHYNFAHHLVQSDLISQHQCDSIIHQAKQNQQSFITELAQSQFLPDELLAKTTADFFKLPFYNLSDYQSNSCPTNLLQLPFIQKHQALPLFDYQHHLKIAVIDPTLPALNEIPFFTEKKIQLLIVEIQKLHNLINTITHQDISQDLHNMNQTELDSLQNIEIHSDPESNINAPIVRFINKILEDAITQNASDIHFEPYENYYRIRFRRDGLLNTVSEPPCKLSSIITARLKILSNLDIAERRIPQDGRFTLKSCTQRSIDFRVNTCPTLHGEKIVLRLLESKIDNLNIESLGMSEIQKTLFLNSLKQAQGMILVTGPTGSGKTTTLYSGLHLLNTLEKNISTVEDPVEIQLAGINQVHINLKTGLTFAVALRAFLRQDPDIMMVGEIRDLETAEIAVKASQTGHLVLSTLHTNCAAETLIRLSNMGIPAYNIASSITLIIAQRLARRLCPICKRPLIIPKVSLREAGFSENELEQLTLFGPSDENCQYCENGYQGRLALFEVMPLSETMARLIMEGSSAQALAQQAQSENIANLRQSGLETVRAGLTSLSEINRIIQG